MKLVQGEREVLNTVAMSPILFEACVDSVESAKEAEEGGAARLELCTNFLEGGTTPSIGMVKVVESAVRIPVHCLIRPRGGDFVYSEREIDVMVEDIQAVASLGVRGVVFGILTPDGDIDVLRLAPLVQLCKELRLDMTFHRAFDMTREPVRALEVLIRLGIPRVLTSGQHPLAVDGIPLLKTLVLTAAGRIAVMAGSGINELSAAEVVRKAGVKELHGSARVAKRTQSSPSQANPAIQSFGFAAKQDIMMTDRGKVQAIIASATKAHMQSEWAIAQGAGRLRNSPTPPSFALNRDHDDHPPVITSNGYFVTESPSNSMSGPERCGAFPRDDFRVDGAMFALPAPAIASPLQDLVVASGYAACNGYTYAYATNGNGGGPSPSPLPSPSSKTKPTTQQQQQQPSLAKPSERSRGVAANALLHVAQWGRSLSRGAAVVDDPDHETSTASSQWSGDGPSFAFEHEVGGSPFRSPGAFEGGRARGRRRSSSMGSDEFGDMGLGFMDGASASSASAVRAAIKHTAVKSAVRALESSLRKADLRDKNLSNNNNNNNNNEGSDVKGSDHRTSDFEDLGGLDGKGGGGVRMDGFRRNMGGGGLEESDMETLDGYAGGPDSPFKAGDVYIRRGPLPSRNSNGGATGSARRVDIGVVVGKDDSSSRGGGGGLHQFGLKTTSMAGQGGNGWERNNGGLPEVMGLRRVSSGAALGYMGRASSVPRNAVAAPPPPAGLRARSPMSWAGELGTVAMAARGTSTDHEREGDVMAADRRALRGGGVMAAHANNGNGGGGGVDTGYPPRVAAMPLSLEMNMPLMGGNINTTMPTFLVSGAPPKGNGRRSSTPERIMTAQNMVVVGSPGDSGYTSNNRMLDLTRDNALAAALVDNKILKMAREDAESAWMNLARGPEKPPNMYNDIGNETRLDSLKLRTIPVNLNAHGDVRNGEDKNGRRDVDVVGQTHQQQQQQQVVRERTPVKTTMGSRDRTPNGGREHTTPTRGVGGRDPTPTRPMNPLARFSSPLRSPGVYSLGKLVD